MLSQVRKFGLHLILANQSIAQLPLGLQQAMGNAQTTIAFRVARGDAEVLARVLGQVDLEAIKRQNKSEIQHPIFSPLAEQWEGIVQTLTTQSVRQALVKTADDRLALIWPEKITKSSTSYEELEGLIVSNLKLHGVRVNEKSKNHPISKKQTQSSNIFTN